jgi:hypothetical protein
MRPVAPSPEEYAEYERQLGLSRVPVMDFTPSWQKPLESMSENMKLVAEATTATNIQVRASEAAAQKRADEAEAAAAKRNRWALIIAGLTLAAAILVPFGILALGG